MSTPSYFSAEEELEESPALVASRRKRKGIVIDSPVAAEEELEESPALVASRRKGNGIVIDSPVAADEELEDIPAPVASRRKGKGIVIDAPVASRRKGKKTASTPHKLADYLSISEIEESTEANATVPTSLGIFEAVTELQSKLDMAGAPVTVSLKFDGGHEEMKAWTKVINGRNETSGVRLEKFKSQQEGCCGKLWGKTKKITPTVSPAVIQGCCVTLCNITLTAIANCLGIATTPIPPIPQTTQEP